MMFGCYSFAKKPGLKFGVGAVAKGLKPWEPEAYAGISVPKLAPWMANCSDYNFASWKE